MKLLLIQTAATWYLTGLVCFVHVVHYPLFRGVGDAGFVDWHARHVKRTGFVVIVPMLIELALAIHFAISAPTALRPAAIAGLVLLLVVWGATFLGAVPAHNQLATGFGAEAHQRLLRADLVRASAWIARAVLLTFLLYRALPQTKS